MAIARHPRPHAFRRVTFERPPQLGAQEVVRDEVVAGPPVGGERPRRALERPTLSIVLRRVTTRTRD